MDHKPCKGVPVLVIDILSVSQVKILEGLLSKGNILYVHFAPPCGTASAARNIKLHRRRHGPPPLRSLEHPMGLPQLTSHQRQRVSLANALYVWTCNMVLLLHSKGVGWSIENPSSSLMWMTTPFQKLVQAMGEELTAFAFHTCMYNAPRKKRTAIWTSVREMLALQRDCDESHVHKPWGLTEDNTFATAEECAYNAELAENWAVSITDYAKAEGLVSPPATLEQTAFHPTLNNDYANRSVVGVQPRGHKLPPVMTDLLTPQQVDVSAFPDIKCLAPGMRLPDNSSFPPGSRLIRFVNDEKGVEVSKSVNVSMPRSMAIMGLPREPEQYVREACRLTHPMNFDARLSKELNNALRVQINEGAMELRKTRIHSSQCILKLAAELALEEKRMHDEWPAHIRRIMKNKRVLLFKRLLEDIGYGDSKVADEMMVGFPLNGWLPESKVFPPHLRLPEIHPDCFDAMIPSFSARTLAAIRSSGDVELDQQLWSATLEEVQMGFMRGPFLPSELPDGALVSPRFGLKQKNKLRPIDDLSVSGVNMSTSLPERLKVDAIDECAAMIKQMLRHAGGKVALVGKTYDLRKAYRQLAIAEQHLRLGWVAVWSPDDSSPRIFQMESMPFGATAAVASFLRVSKAIKVIGTTLGLLAWTSFYDDFICVCKPQDAESTDLYVRFLFKMLGWELSTGPDKDAPFDKVFSALGVQVDLSGTAEGFFELGNTEGRKLELRDRIDGILGAGAMTPAESLSLRSRLLFAESQLFGRFAKLALKTIGSVSLNGKLQRPLSNEVKHSLEWMKDRVINAKPRKIDTHDRPTMFLFLDGACSVKLASEPWSGTSIGGVLFRDDGVALECFGEVLPDEITEAWSGKTKEQLVFEAEVLPFLVSLEIWSKYVRGKLLFVFIDNEAAKCCWIAGSADSKWAQRMIHRGTHMEGSLDVFPYFCRVPTFSNIGDGPSRGRFDMCEKLGAKRVAVNARLLMNLALS